MGGKWLVFVFLTLVLVVNAFAFSANGSEYNLEKGLMTDGGGNSSSSEYDNEFSLGLLIGSLTGSEFLSNLGFYFAEEGPVISVIGPSGTLTTSTVTLEINTNKIATCRYDTSDIGYDSMSGSFSTSTGLYHSDSLTLSDGSYTYYARCKDTEGNRNTVSSIISFIISTAAAPTPTPTGGAAGAEYEGPEEIYIEEFNDTDFVLGPGESAKFRSKGEDHIITILELFGNYAKVEVNSPLILFEIFTEEDYNIDVDEDGAPDVRFTLNKIEDEKAYMSIKYLYARDALCGNGILEPWETSSNCCFDAGCPTGFACVDNICEVFNCGNGICEAGETATNCPEDCRLMVRFVQSEAMRRYVGGFVFMIIALLAIFAFLGYRRVIERERRMEEAPKAVKRVPGAPPFEVPKLPGFEVPEESLGVPSHAEIEEAPRRKARLSEKGKRLMKPLKKVEEEMRSASKRVKKEVMEDGLIGEDYAKKKSIISNVKNGWHYIKDKLRSSKTRRMKSAGDKLRYSSGKFKKKIDDM